MKNTQEGSNKLNKILIISIIVLLGASLILTTVFAYFTARKTDDSQIKVGIINVEIQEDWPDDDYDEFGIERYEKIVQGRSTGDLPAYVRVRCIPVVQYYLTEEGQTEGEWITAPVPQEDIVVWINGEKWVRSGEYYYYKEILQPKQTTGDLNISWEIAEIPSEIANYQLKTDVRVILEYAQTTNNSWKDIFKINSLPEGVEASTR